ncbi:helix-hairpin-helix domain-containing protein [Prolixibacter sp. NT017]|uniref:helix-hairpin-helix domain-containing protein n=1 Tax=Prolixibacter sp. NT017 TaxID=2652390 RepID=UPI00128825D3|nr:helix-hairpin-helix domain-containing protein [Prolixibacter sp. NT017]GET26396.1 competence protein ComEA [Prolixibacter sp. NT017]
MKFPFLRTYFSFSKREKNGVLILLAVLLVMVAINLLLPVIVPSPKYDFTEWEEEVAAYQKKQDSLLREEYQLHPVPFNPNKVSRKELVEMGIAEKSASNWVNYLRKGGHFRKPEDIGKIYGLPDSVSEKLIPFVRMKEDATPRATKSTEVKPVRTLVASAKSEVRAAVSVTENVIPVVDLNRADSVSLEKLPGIGPVLAGRIVRYRRLLGGYYSTGQLKEVYGLRPEHYDRAVPYLKVTADSVRSIQINFASLGDLARHPYISYREAKAVVNKREKEGKIEGFEALGDIFLPEKVEKLQPYIIFAP